MPLNSKQSLYVSERIMICQNQSCFLHLCVWLFVCVIVIHLCFHSRITHPEKPQLLLGFITVWTLSLHTLTSNIHTEHLPSVHKWKTPPCSPRDGLEARSYTTGQKTVQTPKLGRRYAMEKEDRRTQHTHDGHISSYRQLSILPLHHQLWCTPSHYLLSADTNEYDTFSFSQLVFYVNCSAQETQIKWCVLHAWIFRSISVHGTLPRRILRHQSQWLQNIPKYTIDQMLLSEQNTRDQLQFCYRRKILVW